MFQVVCVGQLEPRKRVEDAVKAVARLDGVALTVVGDGKAR
ncbi:MAG: glycosyltransferase family 1 protein, partial [Gammaproteobacteria bacterium]|nr:glycosyltransferase family 4 protein [Gemmatimonadota bacterium]NIU72451.1 glycosyltransferase family 1 protein [Gammaproteobacteria bacterium]